MLHWPSNRRLIRIHTNVPDSPEALLFPYMVHKVHYLQVTDNFPTWTKQTDLGIQRKWQLFHVNQAQDIGKKRKWQLSHLNPAEEIGRKKEVATFPLESSRTSRQ